MASQSPTVGCLLVLLLVSNFANSEDKCRSGCTGETGILKLTPGTTYKYDYAGKINILLSSAEGQETSTDVKATVSLTQLSDCNQVLKLQNVQIIGPDGKKRMGIPGLDKPVVLNNNNGALNDFICSEAGDNQNSLNLKRAIASLFQVIPNKNTEIDVFGQCPTQISKSEAGDTITITKNKNLNSCAFRESISHNIISSAFDIHSERQSSPVLSSNLDSKQTIKAGVLNSAKVVENYLFVPFSVGQNGAKAVIESQLTLTATSKDNPSTKCRVPKSIIFENPHPVNVPRSNAAVIIKKVKEISATIGTNVDDTTAVEFVELVKLLRVSRKPDILSVYNQVKSGAGIADKEGAKKIFLDAILTAGNGDTIEVAIELLKSKELSELEEKQLYLRLSQSRHVTENSIKTAADLLNRPNLPRQAYLGIGSLAGKYCSQHECVNNDQINKIIAKFLSKLGDLKAANRKEESDMIYVLKGLTNIGYLNDVILSKISSIAEDVKQPARLRVAALESYQAAPCKDKLRDSALKILQEIHNDSEIRIKAYLVLTRCPDDKIGNAIKQLLDVEKSQQVGGFISSHIKNIRSSASPDKQLAKAHLGFIHTPSRFLFDPRKYSFNGEFSYSVDSIGLSNNIEGNVIYSLNSWLPRTTNLNLTAEVLGQRFNFLEVAVRQENLDRVIEHYLGPQGILRKNSLQQNWDSTVHPVDELLKQLKEKLNKSLRARRDISKADIDTINKKIQVASNDLDNNLDLDLSIKNFGSEILFLNSYELGDNISPHNIIDNLVSKLNEGLDKIKNFEKTFRSNLLFLDAELSYPTSLGFPLRLGLNGASNIQVKTLGEVDVRKLISSSLSDDINLKFSIIPSATVTVSGRLSLDTPLLENGLKVASTIHSSTGVEILVDTFKGRMGLDVKLSLPVKQQKLIDLKHEIVFQTKENGAVLKNQRLKFSQNKDLSICIDHLVNYIGLEFCVDINGPNLSGKKVPILPFPLSGDARASVKIDRSEIDTFHYKREFFTSKEGMLGLKATLETLGKSGARAAGLDLEASLAPQKYIEVSLNSPIKNAVAKAQLVSNNVEKVIALSLRDEDRLYAAKAGLKVVGVGEKIVYKPIVEYTTPEKQSPQIPPFHVEGAIVAESKGNNIKYTFDDVKLIIPGQKTITLKGNIGNEGPEYFTDLTITDGVISASGKGSLQIEPNLLKIHAQMKNSIRPALNFNINGELKHNKGFFSSNLQLGHGPDAEAKNNAITLINIFHLKDSKEIDFYTKNKILYPLVKLNAKFDLEKTSKSIDYDTYLNLGEVKIGSDLKAKINPKNVEYYLNLKVFGGKNKVELKSTRQAIGSSESKIENFLAVNGKKLEVAGKIKHFVKPNDLHVGADVIIKIPNNHTPYKFVNVLKLNTKEIDFFLKVLAGNKQLIDTLLKANRNGNVNGHVKVDFKEILLINGHIKAQNGVGNGAIIIEAKTVKKGVKAETAFTIKKPTYNLDLTIYPDFTKSKDKKLVLSTKSQCSGSTVDSSTKLNLLGNEFAFNLKGKISSLLSGKTSLDADFTLPGKQCIIGKLQRDVSSKDGVWNSDNLLSLEQRDKKENAGRKIVLKGVSKDTNLKKGVLDIILNLILDDSAGKNVDLDVSIKRQKNGDLWNTQIEQKLSSSLLKHPISTSFSAQGNALARNFKLQSSACPETNIQVQGNYDFKGGQTPLRGEIAVELKLPIQILSSIKSSNSLIVSNAQGIKPLLEFSTSLQTISSNPKLQIDSKQNLKIEGDRNVGSAQLHSEFSQPIKTALDVSGGYNLDSEKRTGTVSGSLKAILPENKIIQGSATLTRIKPHEYKLEGNLDLPTQSFKSNKISIHTVRSNDNKKLNSQIELISDGKKYALSSDLNLIPRDANVDFKLVHPDGKITEFAAGIKSPSNARLLANIKVICQCRDFILEGGVDVNSENLNNFNVQITANCPKININDILIKVGNSGANNGNTLNVLVTSAGKNIVAGSAAVSSRDEQGKYIVEGSGNFKLNNEDKSGNFKYIRTSLTSDKNGESGEEISFDATLGNKAIDAELKLTNKEFRYLNSYCEESKQCAHIEINAKTSGEDIVHYDNQIEITIDLRVLGVPNEFGLKAVTHRDNWLLDQTVDVHFENAANKYQYSIYLHPKELGISLTTPQRIIALEANVDLPKSDIQDGGRACGEIALYTDKKNNPNIKTSLKGTVDLDRTKQSINAELTLNVAGGVKPLTLKYTEARSFKELTVTSSRELIIDIFHNPDQKIVISRTNSAQLFTESYKAYYETNYIIKSVGLGFDITSKDVAEVDVKGLSAGLESTSCIKIGNSKYDVIVKVKGTPRNALVLVNLLNLPIIDAKSDISLQKGLIEINSDGKLLGLGYVQKLEIKNYNTLKLEAHLKDNPNAKLVVNAGVIPSQIADVRAVVLSGNDKKELFHASIKLDDKSFLKPDVGVQTQNIKELSEKVRELLISKAKLVQPKLSNGKEALISDIKLLADKTKEAVPDLRKAQQFYESELSKFRSELATDKTLENLGEILKTIFSTVASTAVKIINTVSEFVEKIAVVLNTSFSGILKTLQTDILPKLKEIAVTLYSSIKEVTLIVSDVVFLIIGKSSEILEAIQPQVKVIASTLSEISEDIQRFIVKAFESIKDIVVEQLSHLENELKASPIIAELKAQYEDFIANGLPSKEVIVNTIRAISGTLREIVMLPEIQNVIDQIEQYIEKKVTNKPVDDAAEIAKISQTFVQGLKQLSEVVTRELLPEILQKLKVPRFNTELLKLLPLGVGSGVRISVLEHLLKEDHKPILNFVLRLVLRPHDSLLPPTLYSEIVLGEAITFDGKLYHEPGSCSYLLAKDVVNGNFTLINSLKDKILRSITYSDKYGTVTLTEDKILLNQVETNYPLIKGGLRAYRHLDYLELHSDVGFSIKCDWKLYGCGIQVSGFYHGQLRGILGNANNEAFDDLILPNGKIVDSIKDLAPGYILGQCADSAPIEITTTTSSPACDKTFGWQSPLKHYFALVPTDNIKKACEYSAASGNKYAGDLYAAYYTYKCWELGYPITVPESASYPCTNSIVDHKIQDQFNVKLPGKLADVAFVINTNKNNEVVYKEFVVPLVGQIVKEFKSKGVTDVVFYFILFGGEARKPSLVTVKGKFAVKDQAPNIKFVPTPKPQKLVTGCPEVDKVIDLIRSIIHKTGVTLALNNPEKSYKLGLSYPFRAEALKSLIAVTDHECEQFLPPLVTNLIFPAKPDVHLTALIPEKHFKVKDEKTTKDVIGFNSKNVLTLSEIKTNPKGSSILYKDLSHSNQCFNYLHSNDGDVYLTNQLLLHKNAKGEIVDLLAKNIVSKALSKEFELDCTCKSSFRHPFVPFNTCEVVSSKEL